MPNSRPAPLKSLPQLAFDDPFPPTDQAWGEADPLPGLLCMGADLSVPRLVDAYSQGIFPWFSQDEPILWWSPDPRMVLEVADFKVSRSFDKVLRQFENSPASETLMDTAFPEVIARCAHAARAGQQGTWIVPAMQAAFIRLHEAGFAHSVETWVDGKLVGGLYFTRVGRAVFGESMFSSQPNTSKIALAHLVNWCRNQGIEWIDCQQQTRHLASLGAAAIARSLFIKKLKAAHAS